MTHLIFKESHKDETERKAMQNCLKTLIRALLPAILMFTMSGVIRAQAPLASDRPKSQAAEHPQSGQQKAKAPTPAAGQGEGAQPQSAAGQQAEDASHAIDQRLAQMRHQLEQEALDRMQYGRLDPVNKMVENVGPFLVFLVLAGSTLWILRAGLENRRWNRMVKMQAETHAKLLDKFGTSQEMLAYMESDAGQRFLELPVFDAHQKLTAGLPFGRILWSVQIGVVAVAVGAGLMFLRGRISPSSDEGFLVLGTLALTIGVGFLLSGGATYVLAKRFGLLERPESSSPHSVPHPSDN
jgi:hypothetical protein